jgi:hypothetical protein
MPRPSVTNVIATIVGVPLAILYGILLAAIIAPVHIFSRLGKKKTRADHPRSWPYSTRMM